MVILWLDAVTYHEAADGKLSVGWTVVERKTISYNLTRNSRPTIRQDGDATSIHFDQSV